MSKPRIAVVTPLFPLRDEPYRGKPIHATVVELQKFADIEVFCPIATYPDAQWLKPVSYQYRKPDLTYTPPGIQKAHYFEYPVFPLISRPLNGYVSGRKLYPLLANYQPDLVLSYWLYPEGFGAVQASKHLGVPCVVGARGSDLRNIKDQIILRFTRQCVRQASFVLTVSEELRQQAIALGVPTDRVRTIINGCDRDVFRPGNRAEARRELGVKPDAQVVLFVGHLIPTKGLRELMEAFLQLAPSHPLLEVVCIGEGPLKAELEGRFRLPGACTGPEVARWMAAANVFCLPSHSEGCPNVVLEALSCDRQVVATAVGGVPELINKDCGYLVPAGDVAQLADALAQSLRSEPAPGSISQKFQRGWDKVAEETFESCALLLRTLV